MAKQDYNDWLKKEFSAQIDSLVLSDHQKQYLRGRWMDQVLWMSGRSNESRNRYYFIKVVTIISGVLVPVIVGSSFGENLDGFLRIAAIVLGLVIAASNALNEFFKFGERWRNYRNTTELLKAEWWFYYSLTGRYEGKTHADGFADFAERVENAIRADVKTYVSEIVKENKPKEEAPKEAAG